MVSKESLKELVPFLRRVKKEFNQVHIILFGSRARNKAKKDSDYDILLISDSFKNVEFTERCMRAYNLRRDLPIAMDILCLTQEEYEVRSKKPTIIQEIAREGKDITALV